VRDEKNLRLIGAAVESWNSNPLDPAAIAARRAEFFHQAMVDHVSAFLVAAESAEVAVTVTAQLRYQTSSKEYVEFLRNEAVTYNFPDDCIERSVITDPQSRGEYLHSVWTTYGRSAPVTMGTSSRVTAVTGTATPGEASRTVQMRVTSYDRATGTVSISYAPACGSTNHTVYSGSLPSVSTMTFAQRDCNRGTSGATSFTLGAGSWFWVIVGNDGVKEGSYGRNSSGVERPEDTGASACNYPRDLTASCGPP
jgi:hypothetical protein